MSRTSLITMTGVILIVVAGVVWWFGIRPAPPTFSPSQALTIAQQPATYGDLIKVDTPLPNTTVSSPLTVSGKARGSWYFEASFPITLLDGNGQTLGKTQGKAQSDWMTADYVPFTANLTYPTPTTATGTLVMKNDNASGDPSRDKILRIPVTFTTANNKGTKVILYYYNPALDQGPGGAQCTSKGLVAVERTITKTATPLADTIRLLLQGQLSDTEQAQGITTEFPLAGVTLTKATIVNSVATLAFADPQQKTSGGSCRVAVLWAQIAATAKQFPTVATVKFEPSTLFQP